MAITNQYGDREYQKFVESTTVSGQLGVVVLNPDGTPISAGGGGGGTTQYADGTAVSVSTVGIVNMGSDGSNLHFLSSNSSGELNLNNISGTISLPTGAATETTLSTIETNTDSLVGLTQTTVGSDTGLDVNIIGGGGGVANAIDSNNSTTSTLGAGATFTGTGTDVLSYTSITVLLKTDQDSATNGMQFQFSTDNTNWDETHNYTYDNSVDSTAREFQFPVHARYFRVVYTNGGVAQTHFRLQTILHGNNVLPGIIRIGDTIYGDRSATLVKSVISGQSSAGGGTYENVKVNPSGSLEVNASQDTHDDFNANVNLQVADTDVSNSNPVPVSDAGGSLTVDNAGLTELEGAINASSQLDVNIAADAVGLATETTLSSVDTKLTTTNSKLTDIETNTDSLAGVTQTTIGSDTGLDVNIIAGGGTGGGDQYVDGYTLVSGEKGNVMLGSDGTNLQFLDVNSSGQLNLNNISGTISLPTGAATETTVSNIYSDTTNILSKVTDIETNTDSLASVTNTTVGAKTGLDVNIIEGVNVEVDLDAADDSVLVYGYDGTSNQKIKTNTSGQLEVSLEVDNVGLATETTLTSILADTASIDTSTQSIDTKLTTTNAKLTDIETNTDILANITSTTIGADVGLDANIINTVDVAVSEANDSILIYAWDGTANQKVKSNTSGQLEVSLEVDNIGLATEATLQSIDTSTQSTDTKLTTTNAKLTDIETNTDILANLTSTTIGADIGLDANIINTVDVSVDQANDSILIYGWDGAANQKVKTNSSGQLEISIDVDNVGLATEATLSNLDATATLIRADTSSIDTKLTTTNTLLTDIETNTDSLATITNTTVGADTGLDVNVINTSLPISLSRVANIQNNQSTGTGNISVNISPGFMFKINAVYLKFQAVPTTNDFTISLFDPANPFYNTTLFSVNPGSLGITDVAWVPDGENIILPSQGIDITFTNTATTQYGLTVIYEYIV